MALPTVAQLKSYLKVETTAEDDQFTLWLARATALIEGLLGKPIVAVSTSTIVQPAQHPISGLWRLMVPYPFTASGMTVTDADGATAAGGTYTANGDTGFIVFDEDATISGYYTVTAATGWSARSDYATKVEPLIAQAITDTVADWYQRRNPGATSETESSASATYESALGIPARVVACLGPILRRGIR